MNIKEQILAAVDVRVEPVKTPEWGVDVCVRVMSGASRDKFEQAVIKNRDGGTVNSAGLRSLLIALTACEADGKLIFTPDDIPAIEEKNAAVLQRVFDASARINGLAPESTEEARADFTPGRS